MIRGKLFKNYNIKTKTNYLFPNDNSYIHPCYKFWANHNFRIMLNMLTNTSKNNFYKIIKIASLDLNIFRMTIYIENVEKAPYDVKVHDNHLAR